MILTCLKIGQNIIIFSLLIPLMHPLVGVAGMVRKISSVSSFLLLLHIQYFQNGM